MQTQHTQTQKRTQNINKHKTRISLLHIDTIFCVTTSHKILKRCQLCKSILFWEQKMYYTLTEMEPENMTHVFHDIVTLRVMLEVFYHLLILRFYTSIFPEASKDRSLEILLDPFFLFPEAKKHGMILRYYIFISTKCFERGGFQSYKKCMQAAQHWWACSCNLLFLLSDLKCHAHERYSLETWMSWEMFSQTEITGTCLLLKLKLSESLSVTENAQPPNQSGADVQTPLRHCKPSYTLHPMSKI